MVLELNASDCGGVEMTHTKTSSMIRSQSDGTSSGTETLPAATPPKLLEIGTFVGT